jgi:hypothetical protein
MVIFFYNIFILAVQSCLAEHNEEKWQKYRLQTRKKSFEEPDLEKQAVSTKLS